MNALAPTYHTRRSATVTARYSSAQLSLIKDTVCRALNAKMFDQFMETAVRLNLDPLKKQILPIVFSKRELVAPPGGGEAKWASTPYLTIITTIDGYRAIADRTGNYRPDENPPRFVYDEAAKDPLTNPLGLVSCEVSVFKFAHGDWHRHTAIAFWDEYVPLKKPFKKRSGPDDYDDEGEPDAAERIDAGTQWGKRPRGQLAKVTEALAIRRGWPEDTGGVYVEEEMDRARIIDGEILDLSPSEAAEQAAIDKRLEITGSKDTVLIDFLDTQKGLEPIPVGKVADRCFAFIRENADQPTALATFQDRNRHGLRQFYALAPTDAHEVKKRFEAAITAARKAADEEQPSLAV